MANPEGAEAEDFLWSLGVGEALPDWLKDLRKHERSRGLNQDPRQSGRTIARPGIGPQRAFSSTDGSEDPTPVRPAAPVMPAAPAHASSAAPSSASAPSRPAAAPRVPVVPVAPAVVAAVAAAAKDPVGKVERRTDPDDGQVRSLEDLRAKYKGVYSEQEVEAYFYSDCKIVTSAITASTATASSASRTQEELRLEPSPKPNLQQPYVTDRDRAPQKFRLSIKEWLANLDESGFLAQYHDSIAAKLDSLEQIVDVYVKADGTVDKQFFLDAGVQKLGHKRLFEKWFRDKCGCS